MKTLIKSVRFEPVLSKDEGPSPNFQNIRLQFKLDTDASEEQLATLLRLTERYCVVFQTLAHPPVMAVSRTRITA